MTNMSEETKELALRYLSAVFMLVAVALSAEARANLPEPDGLVLLTISGQIKETNRGDRAEFDRGMLERLGMAELRTRTPWTEGEALFVGVPLARLLDMVTVKGSMVRATAANDYAVDIPVADLQDTAAFLAMSMDGKPLTLRDKGPLWIIFPWSQRPELDRSEMHGYAVWQLLTLHVH